MFQSRIFKLSLSFLFIFAFFLFCPDSVKAAETVCREATKVKVVARDANGEYIPKVSVDIYKQTVDADGQKKPGVRVGGGTTDATLGIASISFTNREAESATYAIRMRTIAKDSASFYFYDYNFSCGETVTVEETLSGVELVFSDAVGNALTDVNFSVYTQLYDVDDEIQEATNELLGTFTPNAAGHYRLYLPQGSLRGISNQKDYYVLKTTYKGVNTYRYNIRVVDQEMSRIGFGSGNLRLRFKYANGSVVTGLTAEVYTKQVSSAGNEELGKRVGTLTTGTNGYGSLEVSEGDYAVRVKVGNEYQIFWNIYVLAGLTSDSTLTLKDTETSSSGNTTTNCATESKLKIVLKDMSGAAAANLSFKVYEQGTSINGLPTIGAKEVAAGKTDAYGQATVSFKPNTALTYALKVWDKNKDKGVFSIFNVAKFTCGSERTIVRNLPSLNIVLRDSSGSPKYNYAFSLYEQKFDIDGQPTFSSSDLIANLKTDSAGRATIFVPSYDAYNEAQSGIYVLSTKDTNGNVKNFYNIQMAADRDYNFDSSFSGITGELSDAQGRLLTNKTIMLYEQKENNGYYNLGNKLFTTKTNASGQFSFEYQEGKYALVTTDDLGNQQKFWNVSVDSSKKLKELKYSLITFKAPTDITSLKLYYLTGNQGTYYKGSSAGTIKLTNGRASLALAAGPYLVSYTSSTKSSGSSSSGSTIEYGQAFYAKNATPYTVNLSSVAKYSLAGKTSFSLSRAADADAVVATASSVSSSSGSSSGSSAVNSPLAERLKGRILLQVEDKGQAWYVNPVNGKKYSLGSPDNAFSLMKKLALGVSNVNFNSIEKNPNSWKRLAGRILLKPEDSGKAYYFNPNNLKLYYLGRPLDAFNIMTNLGLGVSTGNLNLISSAE